MDIFGRITFRDYVASAVMDSLLQLAYFSMNSLDHGAAAAYRYAGEMVKGQTGDEYKDYLAVQALRSIIKGQNKKCYVQDGIRKNVHYYVEDHVAKAYRLAETWMKARDQQDQGKPA